MLYNELMQCHWLGWEVLSPTRLLLVVPENNRPNTSGLVELAKTLNPNVKAIDVWVEYRRPDMTFHLEGLAWVPHEIPQR